MATTTPDTKVYCADGCKRGVEPGADGSGMSNAGWSYLSITNRWRCVDCWRELREANKAKDDGKQ